MTSPSRNTSVTAAVTMARDPNQPERPPDLVFWGYQREIIHVVRHTWGTASHRITIDASNTAAP